MCGMPRGRPQKVTDKEILEICKATDGPSFTAAEIAKKVSIGPETVRGRLDSLVNLGVLAVKKPSSEKIYWIDSPSIVTGSQNGADP